MNFEVRRSDSEVLKFQMTRKDRGKERKDSKDRKERKERDPTAALITASEHSTAHTLKWHIYAW